MIQGAHYARRRLFIRCAGFAQERERERSGKRARGLRVAVSHFHPLPHWQPFPSPVSRCDIGEPPSPAKSQHSPPSRGVSFSLSGFQLCVCFSVVRHYTTRIYILAIYIIRILQIKHFFLFFPAKIVIISGGKWVEYIYIGIYSRRADPHTARTYRERERGTRLQPAAAAAVAGVGRRILHARTLTLARLCAREWLCH